MPRRGSSRCYWLNRIRTLEHSLADEHDRAAAHKRGGGRAPLALDALEGEAPATEPEAGALP